jgi:phosphate starvation-inducible PhoH-like protein
MVKPKTKNQAFFWAAMDAKTVIIGEGKPGVGKTYLACAFAANGLREKRFERVVLTRPIVSCGRGYGYRPGTTLEKVMPTMRPMLDAFYEFLGEAETHKLIERRVIDILPLDDMRGCSLPNSIILCDEAQNAEYNQLHMLLTRFGKNSKVVLMGDATKSQIDLSYSGENPFRKVIRLLTADKHDQLHVVHFTRADIQRHPFIQWIDERLSEPEE